MKDNNIGKAVPYLIRGVLLVGSQWGIIFLFTGLLKWKQREVGFGGWRALPALSTNTHAHTDALWLFQRQGLPSAAQLSRLHCGQMQGQSARHRTAWTIDIKPNTFELSWSFGTVLNQNWLWVHFRNVILKMMSTATPPYSCHVYITIQIPNLHSSGASTCNFNLGITRKKNSNQSPGPPHLSAKCHTYQEKLVLQYVCKLTTQKELKYSFQINCQSSISKTVTS